VSISNPGSEPLSLGALSLAGTGAGALALSADGCSAQTLEPGEACTASVRFAPQAAGAAHATLAVPSDNGTLEVPVSAFAPSVASLTWSRPAFEATGEFDRAGQVQRLVLEVRNPLPSTQVPVASSALAGPRRNGFAIESNRCRWIRLAPGATCRISVLFRPRGSAAARATLTLRGGGASVLIGLRAGAFAPPAVRRVAAGACSRPASRSQILVVTDEPAVLKWRALRWTSAFAPGCGPSSDVRGALSRPGRSSASGRARATAATVLRRGTGRSVARFALPRGLRPGTYLLSVVASNAHGMGQTQHVGVTVLPS
jgi:hypothetical protein